MRCNCLITFSNVDVKCHCQIMIVICNCLITLLNVGIEYYYHILLSDLIGKYNYHISLSHNHCQMSFFTNIIRYNYLIRLSEIGIYIFSDVILTISLFNHYQM
jgi:hypothetical protein